MLVTVGRFSVSHGGGGARVTVDGFSVSHAGGGARVTVGGFSVSHGVAAAVAAGVERVDADGDVAAAHDGRERGEGIVAEEEGGEESLGEEGDELDGGALLVVGGRSGVAGAVAPEHVLEQRAALVTDEPVGDELVRVFEHRRVTARHRLAPAQDLALLHLVPVYTHHCVSTGLETAISMP